MKAHGKVNMDVLEQRRQFKTWIIQCCVDGQGKLKMSTADVIICLAEELKVLVDCEYAQRIRG